MGVWVPTCVAAVISVCVAVLFPRAPTWQIMEMRFRGVSINYLGMGVDMRIDMGIEVFNPNYVPARLNGVVMTMFHENLEGKEAPFGVVTFSGENAANLPARGSAVVQAEMEVLSLSSSMIMGIAKDASEEGIIISRTTAVMDMTVLGGDLLVDADCEQHVRAGVFPIKIVHLECSFYFKSVQVPVLPP